MNDDDRAAMRAKTQAANNHLKRGALTSGDATFPDTSMPDILDKLRALHPARLIPPSLPPLPNDAPHILSQSQQ